MASISDQYDAIESKLAQLDAEVLRQLEKTIGDSSVVLAHPIEHRVKELSSLLEKVQRNGISEDTKLNSLTDLVGYRLVLLFRRDLAPAEELIRTTFQVIESENVADRLSEIQFGYQSIHYICKITSAWAAIPSFAGLEDIQFEIQLRTAAQHIWAAASQKLQYKAETSVPSPLRRSIHRVAALLETVDLEYERVLLERADYEKGDTQSVADEVNVVSLKGFLKSYWPEKNWYDGKSPFDELAKNLDDWGIKSMSTLKKLLETHKEKALSEDRKRGRPYSHVGLTRAALEGEFGDQWHERSPNEEEG